MRIGKHVILASNKTLKAIPRHYLYEADRRGVPRGSFIHTDLDLQVLVDIAVALERKDERARTLTELAETQS